MKRSFLYSRLFIAAGLLMVIMVALAGVTACKTDSGSMEKEVWGETQNKQIYLYTIRNSSGSSMKVTNYGAIITSILMPDKNGKLDDVVLGFDNLQQYLEPNPCFGAAIGRFANRIRNAQFSINDSIYKLLANEGDNCLHGGNEFDQTVWDAELLSNELGKGVRLHYLSKDGTNGFPGNLDVYVTYLLSENNAIHISYEAQTDKATHVNLTQHSYFNLTGCKELIYDHRIKIDADTYPEIDELVIPTGPIATVKGTDWDLTKMTRMGDNIKKLAHNGYHFCYIFNKPVGQLAKVIEVEEPVSGRTFQVTTTQPGVQFYSGNAIPSDLVGKYNIQYKPHIAFCLETQHLPDSPNHSNFPSTLLHPGDKYEQTVIWKFGVFDK